MARAILCYYQLSMYGVTFNSNVELFSFRCVYFCVFLDSSSGLDGPKMYFSDSLHTMYRLARSSRYDIDCLNLSGMKPVLILIRLIHARRVRPPVLSKCVPLTVFCIYQSYAGAKRNLASI